MPTNAELRRMYDEGGRGAPRFYGSHTVALRAVYEAGVAAERERCARIAKGHVGSHGISASQYARIIAKVHEPDLDWDNPAEFDLLDREELTASAEKILAALAWAGFVIQSSDDLALDEFDLPAAEPDSSEDITG